MNEFSLPLRTVLSGESRPRFFLRRRSHRRSFFLRISNPLGVQRRFPFRRAWPKCFSSRPRRFFSDMTPPPRMPTFPQYSDFPTSSAPPPPRKPADSRAPQEECKRSPMKRNESVLPLLFLPRRSDPACAFFPLRRQRFSFSASNRLCFSRDACDEFFSDVTRASGSLLPGARCVPLCALMKDRQGVRICVVAARTSSSSRKRRRPFPISE